MKFTSRWQMRCLLSVGGIAAFVASLYAVGFNQSDSFNPAGKKLTSGTQVAESNSLIDDQRMSDFVKELASEKYEGRLPGTDGDKLSIEMVVNEFKKLVCNQQVRTAICKISIQRSLNRMVKVMAIR